MWRKKNLIRSRCGMQRHEAAHCSASHPVERTVPSERHFRIGLVATTPRTLVPAQVPDCFVSSSESSSVTEVLVDGGWFLEHMCTLAPKLMNIIGQIWMHASQPFCRWTASCTATTSLVGDVQVAQRLLDRHTHLLGLWVLARRWKSRSSFVRGQIFSARA